MNKFLFIQCIFLLGTRALPAQQSIYDHVLLGSFQVGVMDTVLMDSTYTYRAFGYFGPTPHFIRIWHPIEASPESAYLPLNEFFSFSRKDKFAAIRQHAAAEQEKIIIRDCIEENARTGEPNVFDELTYKQIIRAIGQMTTRSKRRSLTQPSSYPIIIYHHGSQSGAYENVVMAEYFASRGFIFIAADFHLPFEQTIYGLKPYDQLFANEEEAKLKTVLQFAQSISNSSDIFFAGHSLGAQMGLRSFDGETSIKGFISLETTLEYKTDREQIREMWPEVYRKVEIEKAYYPFPILFCAATGEAAPFNFLKDVNAPSLMFASTAEEFAHNAYLSIYYQRLFLDDSIQQEDKDILSRSLPCYLNHLALMDEFIHGIISRQKRASLETRFIDRE